MATRLAQRLIQGARQGDARAQVGLGKLYISGGEGLPANHNAALHWLSQAAREGVTEADALIAECVALDRAGPAIHHYAEICKRAAERGDPAGLCALGDIYASQGGSADALSEAQAAYRAAAKAGYVTAARKLGLLLANESTLESRDASAEAVQWLHSAAVAGDQPAAQGLGQLLWHNGDQDAARWLEPEAQRGDPEAMYRLGEILCRHSDAERPKLGAYWLERAARQGHSQALWHYGRLHIRDFGNAATGLPHSPLQASRLLERAAAQGLTPALWDLARIYEMSRFSKRDLGKARQYLEQAANSGIGEAQLELGKRLSRYKNDRKAWIAAGQWLSRAADNGLIEARTILKRIADSAPGWPQASLHRQEDMLSKLRDSQPIIAARLELAARFGLSAREMLFINPLDIDRLWGIEIDLFRHFKRMPWRLVIIESADQRLALQRACDAFLSVSDPGFDLTALSTSGRARQLKAICARLAVNPALFVHNWNA